MDLKVQLRTFLRSRVGASLAVLAVASVVSGAVVGYLFFDVRARQSAAQASVRENALWAAYQADREAARFHEQILVALRDPNSEALAQVILRYDVLYSRTPVLQQTVKTGGLELDPDVVWGVRSVVDTVRGAAETIDPLVGNDAAIAGALVPLEALARDIRHKTEALATAASVANNEARVAEREVIVGGFNRIAGGVAVLTVALALLAGTLLWQIAHILRTSRKLAELSERNARAAEEAQAGSRAKTAFLATMSHEIRTPLNGIIGMADLLAATRLTASQAKQVSVIRQSGDLLLDVITDVLDYSKLESGKLAPKLEDVAIHELCEQIRNVLAPRAEAKGLRLGVEAPDALIRTDPALLRQVIVNLMGNAIKFTQSGLVHAILRGIGEDRMRVTVLDSGVGIPPEAIPRLFKEFSQVDDSYTRRYGGTGLGLAISKRLVESLGGEIGVRSVQGEGSSFWFDIPVGPIRPVKRALAAPTAEVGEGRYSGRVLVVEDNVVNRQVAGGLLARSGLDVVCAENGAEALEQTEAMDYDIVFMDMQMPVLDGLSATREMRARGYAGPIVGLTANAFTSDRDACFEAGMDDFLSKPLTRAKLQEVLGRFLRRLDGAAASDAAAAPEDDAPARAAAVARSAAAETEAVPAADVAPEDAADAPAPSPAGGDAEIDMAHRQALVDELGQEVVDELVAAFSKDAMDSILAARAALASGDAQTLDRALHTIKGAAQTLGFVGVGRLAQESRGAATDEATLDRLERAIRASGGGDGDMKLCA
jgi:signal transduction histidine kinase/DNA-binding response OmpR family regulator